MSLEPLRRDDKRLSMFLATSVAAIVPGTFAVTVAIVGILQFDHSNMGQLEI